MKHFLTTPYRLTVVWVVLLAATATSWALGRQASLIADRDIGTAIVVVAVLKIYLVMLEFMELRRAPLFLRAVCELWIVGIGAGIVALYRF